VENKTVEMVVKDLLLADNQKKKKKNVVRMSILRTAQRRALRLTMYAASWLQTRSKQDMLEEQYWPTTSRDNVIVERAICK